ncbi:class I SAM-dependent methyltransferase [Amycolatopsis palatopharyngis]|uniref:class I SAM-dependent methyltransferase n=1 Tax=Amycolatopsis palatopharyngis TaxID=187982 RepID=UPI000E26018E|nr:class I SAM-dependent methyltransferase [Amycolatopsis palatopharyngis]
MSTQEFNAGYRYSEIYEEVLPPHYYGGKEDLDLVRDYLSTHLGPPPDAGKHEVLELGCGPGRLTSLLAPYAARLLATDKSEGMISAVRQRFADITTRCTDTESVVHALHREGRSNSFDLIGAFWSMSYPLLECFEETTADGVVSTTDPEQGRTRARSLLQHLVDLLAPGGHMIMLFFDANTEEQRLVTNLWERIAPFPGTGRDYTWNLLHDALIDADIDDRGTFHHARLPGVAVLRSTTAAQDWFLTGHLNNYAKLCNDPRVHSAIDAFVHKHLRPDGTVHIPSAVHFVDFHADTNPSRHLPTADS